VTTTNTRHHRWQLLAHGKLGDDINICVFIAFLWPQLMELLQVSVGVSSRAHFSHLFWWMW